MEYSSYSYVTPPRAEKAISPDFLGFYQGRGWVAQVKKNGTNSVIYVPPKQNPFAKTRHADKPDHKQWCFTPGSMQVFLDLGVREWAVFNAELMHSKGNGIRDTNYIHDVLVWQGEMLVGETYEARHKLLQSIFKTANREETQSHWVVDDHTWVAKSHKDRFKRLFDSLENEDEGLVLKNPKGKLTIRNNTTWLVKCRRPHKNFGF